MKKSDLLWIAGLLEGEGSFGTDSNNANPTPIIQCGMCDKDVIAQLARLTNSKMHGPYKGTNKPRWYWGMQRWDETLDLMRQLLPHMGKRRSKRIREVLAFCRTKKCSPNKRWSNRNTQE